MKWFLYLMGFFFIASGSSLVLYTQRCRDLVAGMLSGRYDKAWGVLAGAVGVLLIASARYSQNVWPVMIIGIIVLAKGLLLFFNPGNVFEAVRRWCLGISDQTYRLVGIILLILGTAFFSWI